MKRNDLLLLAFILLLPLVPSTGVSAQEEVNRAGLVVVGDEVEARCVTFSEETITGYELLVRSGIPFETQAAGLGATLCAIDGVGCPASNCFCECKGGGDDCTYWSYWHLTGDGWQYSGAGATVYQVSDGAVDGWVWGPGSSGEAPPPPLLSLDEICAAAAGDVELVVAEQPVPAETTAAPDPAAVAEGGWLSYAVFGLIAGALALFLLLRRPRSSE